MLDELDRDQEDDDELLELEELLLLLDDDDAEDEELCELEWVDSSSYGQQTCVYHRPS